MIRRPQFRRIYCECCLEEQEYASTATSPRSNGRATSRTLAHRLHLAQAKAGPRPEWLRREEGLEHAGRDFGRDAAAGISHLNRYIVPAGSGALTCDCVAYKHVEAASAQHCMLGVDSEVDETQLQLIRISLDCRRVFGEPARRFVEAPGTFAFMDPAMSWVTVLIAALAVLAVMSLTAWLVGPLSELLVWLSGHEEADSLLHDHESITSVDEVNARGSE